MKQENTRDPKKMSSYFWYEAPIFVVVTISGLIYNIGMVAGPYFQGQLQLLMIARSVVCDPQILLLDEMTVSLDKETEAKVLKAIDAASRGGQFCPSPIAPGLTMAGSSNCNGNMLQLVGRSR